MCPHKRAFVLEHGIIGDDPNSGTLYVSCTCILRIVSSMMIENTMLGPMHKRNFSLSSGVCLNDDNYSILAFDVKVQEGSSDILVLLPEPEELDAVIATSRWMIRKDTAEPTNGGIEIVGPHGGRVDSVLTEERKGDLGCARACGDSQLEW